MNWQPTLLVLSLYLAFVGLLILGNWLWQRADGELRKRLNLMWLAATGNDYTQPQFDPGMFSTSSFDAPGQAEDPITAILVRSSEAERQWYALHHLLDRWEQHWKHQMMLQPQEERAISRFLVDKYREAQQEAADQIQQRIQMHHHTADDGMAERYIIEDPATEYRQQIQMSHRDLVRFEPEPGGRLPPAVQQRIDSFPQHVLREVEQRSDTLEARV